MDETILDGIPSAGPPSPSSPRPTSVPPTHDETQIAASDAPLPEAVGDDAVVAKFLAESRLVPTSVLRTLLEAQQRARSAGAPVPRLAELLAARGAMTPGALDATPVARATVPVPSAGAGEAFGRFLLEEMLGRGGMGEVHRAYDPGLQRPVALKLLTHDDPEELERFLREARTAARLHHPNIVAIHEAGQHPRPFIVMDFIDGVPLSSLRLPPRRALEVLRDAARAVHHANEEGIVHRDLKPANLMLDTQGRVTVMDFGLARSVRERDLTVTGRIMGTPHYMSPEQADGHVHVDRRTDVYGLGATLYYLLSSHPPAEGETMYNVIWRVVQQDAVPVRRHDPSIPVEVETLVMKCLEKDPARRYESAAALADDIDRYLAGDAIQAQPPSAVYRLRKRIRKNARLFAVGAVGVGAVLLTLGVLVPRWRGAERRVAEERGMVVEQMRRTAAVTLTAALEMRRIGQTQAMQRFADDLAPACGQAIERAPELAEPHFHLGRLDRALLRFEEARVEQDRALAKDPVFAPSLYELALARTRAYALELERARERAAERAGTAAPGVAGTELPAPTAVEELERRDEALARVRGEAVRAIETLETVLAARPDWRDHPHPVLRVGPEKLACVRGILAAFGAGSWEEGRARLEEAIAQDPTLEEAYAALAMGAARLGRWDEAIRASTRGIEADRGYAEHWSNRARAHTVVGHFTRMRGGDPEGEYAAAIEDAAKAIELSPKEAFAWEVRAEALAKRGLHRHLRGADAAADFDAAAADFARAVERAPAAVRPRVGLATLRINRAIFESDRGGDPGPQLDAAFAVLDETLKVAAGVAYVWERRAYAWLVRGHTAARRSEDPSAAFAQAVADCDRALAIDPRAPDGWHQRGAIFVAWADAKNAHGRDPRVECAAAAESFSRAIELMPGDADGWFGRGRSGVLHGNWLIASGADPSAAFAAAEADFDAAIRTNPAQHLGWHYRAQLRRQRGDAVRARGGDPRADYEGALADLDRVVAMRPTEGVAWIERGLVHTNRAAWLGDHGQDALAEIEAGIAAFDRALALNESNADGWLHRGGLRTNLGLARMGKGQDPAQEFAAAESDLDRAAQLQPSRPEVWMRVGTLHLSWGLRHMEEADGGARFGRALDAFGKALALVPTAELWKNRAAAHSNVALWKMKRGEDPEASFAAAVADCAKALEMNPRLADVHRVRGAVHGNWANYRINRGQDALASLAATVADFEASLRINPDQPELKQWLVLARAAFEEARQGK